MKTILGIDIGTSGTKTILVDDQGRVIAAKTIEYPMETPKPGWTQQKPQDWWAASVESIRTVLAKANVPAQDIAAIGLSGQMHGMVALDEHDQVVRPAILWNDQRTEKQCEEITEAAGGLEELLKLTNNRMLTGYTGGKILWMKENEPENFAKTRVILNPKDYIRFMLTGEKATEVADASGTGFFDVKNRVFSDELIAKLGLPRSLFPRCYESYEVAGTVTEEVAKLTGLRAGLPVTAGGGDAVALDDHRAVVQRRLGEENITDQLRGDLGVEDRACFEKFAQGSLPFKDDQCADLLPGHTAAGRNRLVDGMGQIADLCLGHKQPLDAAAAQPLQ